MDVGVCESSYYVSKQSAYLKFANMFVKGKVLKFHITFYYSIQDEIFCCFGSTGADIYEIGFVVAFSSALCILRRDLELAFLKKSNIE